MPESFELDGPVPLVVVEAGTSKRRRRDEHPLQPDLVGILREYLEDRPADQPVWPGSWSDRATDMLKIDLEAAGIPYVSRAGEYADFHAQRHTYTTIAAKHLPPRMARALARHSTPALTERYTHLELHDTGAATAQLPPLIPGGGPQVEHLRATGTDGDSKRGESVALCVARKAAKRSNSVQSNAVEENEDNAPDNGASPFKTRGNASNTNGWGGIRTPGGLSPSAVFKTAAIVHSATHPVDWLPCSGQLYLPGWGLSNASLPDAIAACLPPRSPPLTFNGRSGTLYALPVVACPLWGYRWCVGDR